MMDARSVRLTGVLTSVRHVPGNHAHLDFRFSLTRRAVSGILARAETKYLNQPSFEGVDGDACGWQVSLIYH